MSDNGLELVATDELIDELMRRTTFQGVILHSEAEAKSPTWTGERVFRLHYNANLDAEQIGRLLQVVSWHLDSTAA